MSKYTEEIREIIDDGINIFDFTFTRKPESIQVLSDEDLTNGFIRHFYFREIGVETVDRFKYLLETQWKESLGEFDALLTAYNTPINPKANYKGKSSRTGISNDTPMNALDFGEESTHASFIQHDNSDNEGYSNTTEIELLELYHKHIRDIQTEFYDSFDNLFMQIF